MKQIFINLLSQRFKHFGLKTVTANDDADLLIAKTAIPKKWDIPVNVICKALMSQAWSGIILIERVTKLWWGTQDRIWEIRKLVNTGSKDYIFLDHVISSFNTTYRIYGLGKERVLKTDEIRKPVKHASLAFHDSSNQKKIFKKLAKVLLGWSNRIKLDEAQDKCFMERIYGKWVVKPEDPPLLQMVLSSLAVVE